MSLRATFLTLFPDSLRGILDASILGRAQKAGLLEIDPVELRTFSTNKHRTVDEPPAGGGAGMVIRIDVVAGAIQHAIARDEAIAPGRKRRIVLLDARGAPFTQADARRLATYDHLVLVCGRYEGIDARVEHYIDEAISIGDYVLTGGELAALVVLDASVRHLPGALGNEASPEDESHGHGLLEYRQYTRPVTHDGWQIPPVLLSGNHRDIARARRKDALLLTERLRPDLAARHARTREDDKILADARVPVLAAPPAPISAVESTDAPTPAGALEEPPQ